MERIESSIWPDDPSYKSRKESNLAVLKEWQELMAKVMKGGPIEAVKRHHERGKLTARERIELLCDEGTGFLEFSALAANGQYDDAFPSAGIITGMALIQGREAVVIANDATVKGGTYISETIKKHVRALEIALENHLPCVYMVDSGGVYLPEQSKVFPDKDHFGRIFYYQARLSAAGLPQVALVMGSCTAGGAYIPAMADETIIVKNQGTIFIAGPPLVKAATGEEVTAEELGGADVHTKISGVADHLAENDHQAIAKCREIFLSFAPPFRQPLAFKEPIEPLHSPRELDYIMPDDLSSHFDSREVIARIVDESKLNEFKKEYAPTLVTGFAHIMGIPLGIVANNGVLYPETSLKGAHFIELCAQRRVPILFLQNVTGFMVGKDFEHKGIARDGAKMVHAVANANVPLITLIIGSSNGAGNYAMAGRAFNPRFLWMWPNARISVMGGTQASQVLKTVKQDKNEENLIERYERESRALFATSRVWDDGIIQPSESRYILARALSAALNKPFPAPQFGVFRM